MAITYLDLVNTCLRALDQPVITDVTSVGNPDEVAQIRDNIRDGISLITSAFPSYSNWINTTTVTPNSNNQIDLSAITDPARIISLLDINNNTIEYDIISSTVIKVPLGVGILTLQYSGRPAMPVNNNDVITSWSDDMMLALKLYVLYQLKTLYGQSDADSKYQLFTQHLGNLTAIRQSFKAAPRKVSKPNG